MSIMDGSTWEGMQIQRSPTMLDKQRKKNERIDSLHPTQQYTMDKYGDIHSLQMLKVLTMVLGLIFQMVYKKSLQVSFE